MASRSLALSSSAISYATYNEETESLTIGFVKGGSHTYSDVPESIVKAFEQSGSKGKYFNNVIKHLF